MTRTSSPGRVAATAFVAASLALSGCSAVGGPDGQPLIGAQLLADDAIAVHFSGCDNSPHVDVFESESTVRVTVDGPNGGCEPINRVVVELEEPLGDRAVIDGATGKEVEAVSETSGE